MSGRARSTSNQQGLTSRFSWHRVGALGCVFLILAALGAYLPSSDDPVSPMVWTWAVGWLVAIGGLALLLRGYRTAAALSVWPAVALAEIALFLSIDKLAATALVGALSLVCLFSGLTQRRRVAWWVAPPSIVLLWTTLNLPGSVTVVRLCIVAVVFVLLCQIPATLLHRVHQQEALLNAAASTDPLTGLQNRREMDDLLDSWSGRGAVALIDLDKFKIYNDTHGHAAGDVLLRLFATFLTTERRENDVVVRYGGEEFLVILPNVGLDGAVTALSRWSHSWQLAHPDLPTFSAGVAPLVGRPSVREADLALYEAKRTGRNRVVAWREDLLLPPGTPVSIRRESRHGAAPSGVAAASATDRPAGPASAGDTAVAIASPPRLG